MTAGKREGPHVRRICIGCRWLHGESYHVQGDSGTDYFCTHPSILGSPKADRHIGDSKADTPIWCPVIREGGAS